MMTEVGKDGDFRPSIARYVEVRRAIASINLESDGSSSSSSRVGRLHLLCTYLMQDTQGMQGDAVIKSPFQLAQLLSLVRQHVAPGCLLGQTVQACF